MNDSKNNPKSFPPDDFSATTPNIKIPKQDLPDYSGEPVNDWEKTNYNYSPKDLQADQWNKPSYDSTPPIQHQPPARNTPKDADWGMTQANINIPRNQPSDFNQTQQGNFGSQRRQEYGETSPFLNLPENERQKYQNNAPPPVAAVKSEEITEEKKGGIPIWAWASGGLLALFLFSIVILAGAYFLFFNKTGFNVTVTGAPKGSDIRVNGSSWGVTTADGDDKNKLYNYALLGLKAGETKKIDIVAPGWSCNSIDEFVGEDGKDISKQANCTQKAVVTPPKAGCDPNTFTKNDIQKSHACANEKLDALTESFTVEELREAMNLYIIQFASGKFNINPEDMKFLEKSAGFIKKLPPNVQIEVGGHTDNTGKNNQLLSENRANAVKNALLGFGVKPDVLLTRGYADTQPKDTNDTEDGKFRNRRIEYKSMMR